MSDNRYKLKDSTRDVYLGLISAFICKLDNYSNKLNNEKILDENSEFVLNLTDTELNPYTLKELLTLLGYKEVSLDSNGWQLDFQWTFVSETADSELTRELVIWGTGLTFELNLSNKEDM